MKAGLSISVSFTGRPRSQVRCCSFSAHSSTAVEVKYRGFLSSLSRSSLSYLGSSVCRQCWVVWFILCSFLYTAWVAALGGDTCVPDWDRKVVGLVWCVVGAQGRDLVFDLVKDAWSVYDARFKGRVSSEGIVG